MKLTTQIVIMGFLGICLAIFVSIAALGCSANVTGSDLHNRTSEMISLIDSLEAIFDYEIEEINRLLNSKRGDIVYLDSSETVFMSLENEFISIVARGRVMFRCNPDYSAGAYDRIVDQWEDYIQPRLESIYDALN